MADFATNPTDAYENASGTIALDTHAIGVMKFKPAESSRDGKHEYESGSTYPVAITRGPVKPGNPTFTVLLDVWARFIVANPDYAERNWTIAVSYKKSGGASCALNARGCKWIKATPTEADMSAAGAPGMDIEFMTLGTTIAGINS